MLTPFQRLLWHRLPGPGFRNILIAASGPCLRSFDGVNGQFISKWSHLEAENSVSHVKTESDEGILEGSPVKKRKLDSGNVSESPSAEILIENGSGRRKPKRYTQVLPSITLLCSTSDGRHVVIVTGEDKAVRVLTVSESGEFRQFSQRVLPKRPSALVLTPDEATILVSDKFGDVYSMPLLGQNLEADPIKKDTETIPEVPSEELFQPSASSLTVHTKRNLRALEAQQKQKKVKKQQKQELCFDHELVLGHVSLLTDLACVKIHNLGAVSKTYILTADRDEHIRVSRGLPQAHIIETFCLGHEQYISKLHVPKTLPGLLISGGGDDYILLWDWQDGKLRQKIDLKAHFEAQLQHFPAAQTSKPAVSGIWSWPTSEDTVQVIIAFEATNFLICLPISTKGNVDESKIFVASVSYNVLDIAIQPDLNAIIVSQDASHQPWAKSIAADPISAPALMMLRVEVSKHGYLSEVMDSQLVNEVNSFAKTTTDSLTASLDATALGEMFYNIEHLRKRGGWEEEP